MIRLIRRYLNSQKSWRNVLKSIRTPKRWLRSLEMSCCSLLVQLSLKITFEPCEMDYITLLKQKYYELDDILQTLSVLVAFDPEEFQNTFSTFSVLQIPSDQSYQIKNNFFWMQKNFFFNQFFIFLLASQPLEYHQMTSQKCSCDTLEADIAK